MKLKTTRLHKFPYNRKNTYIKHKEIIMKKTNPFYEENAIPVSEFRDWSAMTLKPYNKNTASPYTKTRVILMNGTEFEQCWFLHNFSRHEKNNDLRRELALLRRHEQQQQKVISSLKPVDESPLETTISYEQLAVDLTAVLARHVKDENVKNALNFALLEDFDHLYRFANLLESEQGKSAKDITREYTEIMPGRPTIAEHRHPFDAINNSICNLKSDLFTVLVTNIITAAEQQTMNYYMNIGDLHPTSEGRKLYAEIAMIEEQHVTEYGSLLDTTCGWLENLIMHEYTECYLYHSCALDETDKNMKKIYERLYLEECGHLIHSKNLYKTYAGKDAMSLFPDGADFPEPLMFEGNIEYIRDVIARTDCFTKKLEGYECVHNLPSDDVFRQYNKSVNKRTEAVASHNVIDEHIRKFGKDYRYEVKEHPVTELASRTHDNTTFAR